MKVRPDSGRGRDTIRRYRQRIYAAVETLVMGKIYHPPQSCVAQYWLVRNGVRHAEERVRPDGSERLFGRRVQRIHDPLGFFHARWTWSWGASPAGDGKKDHRSCRQRLRVRGHEGSVRQGKGRTSPRQSGCHVWRKVVEMPVLTSSFRTSKNMDWILYVHYVWSVRTKSVCLWNRFMSSQEI